MRLNNIRRENEDQDQAWVFENDARGRLIRTEVRILEYDPQGHLIRNEVQVIEHDPENDLIRVQNADGAVINYEFDHLNRPISEQVRVFEYDPEGPLIEAQNADRAVMHFEYNAFDPLLHVQIDEANFQFRHFDAFGQEIQIENDRVVARAWDAGIFGNPRNNNNQEEDVAFELPSPRAGNPG